MESRPPYQQANSEQQDDNLKHKPASVVLRDGNIAYTIDRPLFNEPSNGIKMLKLKEHYLEKQPADSSRITLPQPRYLDDESQELDQETVILASYPRSGNTLLRAYLEKMMGLCTGSDCDIEKKLNKELLSMGLQGEGLVDKRVWVVKTHYPERYGKSKFYSERCILEVRNPCDAITSLFNMVCTGSHNKSIHNGDYQKFLDHWDEFIKQEITVWKDFHDFWLNSKIPVHVIRYEDILTNPKNTMMQLMKFIINEPNIEGTRIEKYIDLTVSEKAPEIYKPRQGQVNSNNEKFNREQLEYMYKHCPSHLQNFGYQDTFLPQVDGD